MCNLDDGDVRDEREAGGEARQECRKKSREERGEGDASSGGSPPRPSACHGFVLATSPRVPLRPQSSALTCEIPATRNNKYLGNVIPET